MNLNKEVNGGNLKLPDIEFIWEEQRNHIWRMHAAVSYRGVCCIYGQGVERGGESSLSPSSKFSGLRMGRDTWRMFRRYYTRDKTGSSVNQTFTGNHSLSYMPSF